MSDDYIRTNLVFRLRCASCWRVLRMTYNPKGKDNHVDTGEWDDDRITGAAKVEATVYVHPCEHCYGESRRPLELLKEAIGAVEKENKKP